MGKIKAILFDYDGTLMDTNHIILESWQHTFRQIEGKEHSEDEIYATFGEILHDTMEKFFPDRDTEECIKIYRGYQEKCYKRMIEMFPGTKELIQALKERGFLLALVTSRLPETTMEGLEKWGLTDSFDAVVTCADTDKHKPDPMPALIAISRLGVKPEECLMVGDTVYDMQCGKRAGARTILVGWSFVLGEKRRGELAGDAKPDFIAEQASDILRLAEGL